MIGQNKTGRAIECVAETSLFTPKDRALANRRARWPALLPEGDMIVSEPSAFRSIKSWSLAEHKSNKSSSLSPSNVLGITNGTML